MSNWREIMTSAQETKEQLIKERALGEKAFDELLKRFPCEGMVYFKRGEAWDFTDQPELALCDYKRAVRLFRMENWRKRAKAAIERVERWVADPADLSLQSVGEDSVFARCDHNIYAHDDDDVDDDVVRRYVMVVSVVMNYAWPEEKPSFSLLREKSRHPSFRKSSGKNKAYRRIRGIGSENACFRQCRNNTCGRTC